MVPVTGYVSPGRPTLHNSVAVANSVSLMFACLWGSPTFGNARSGSAKAWPIHRNSSLRTRVTSEFGLSKSSGVGVVPRMLVSAGSTPAWNGGVADTLISRHSTYVLARGGLSWLNCQLLSAR